MLYDLDGIRLAVYDRCLYQKTVKFSLKEYWKVYVKRAAIGLGVKGIVW